MSKQRRRAVTPASHEAVCLEEGCGWSSEDGRRSRVPHARRHANRTGHTVQVGIVYLGMVEPSCGKPLRVVESES